MTGLANAARALDAAGVRWMALGDARAGHVPDLLVANTGLATAVLTKIGFLPVRQCDRGARRRFVAPASHSCVGYEVTLPRSANPVEATALISPTGRAAPRTSGPMPVAGSVDGTWVLLDILDYLDLRTPVAASAVAVALHRRMLDGWLWRPSSADAPWLLLLSLAAQHTPLRPSQLAELALLAGTASDLSASKSVAPMIRGLLPQPHDLGSVLYALRDREAAAQIVMEVRARLPVGRLRRRERLPRRHRPVHAVPGLSLGVVGPDGSGKTTLLRGLQSSLPLPTAYAYLGVWKEGSLEDRVRRIPGAVLGLRLIRLSVAGTRVRWHRSHGRVVLMDRAVFEADMSCDADADWRQRLTASLVQRLAPHPDQLVLLDGPPELFFDRKGEDDVAALGRRRAWYLEQLQYRPEMTVVDATCSPEEVRARVAEIIHRALLARAR